LCDEGGVIEIDIDAIEIEGVEGKGYGEGCPPPRPITSFGVDSRPKTGFGAL